MAGQALYLKYRPHIFDDMIGQEHITQTLRNALAGDRLRHAYLFSGPRGTGKTTTARLLAKAVNCTETDPQQRPCDHCDACVAVNEGRYLDLIEIDAASNNGVDDVRELRDKITFAPNQGRFKVYVIDEVHRFSGSAFDALLKTLEEPPAHAFFILATTELDKVPATIKSRCLKFEFRRVPLQAVAARLWDIAQKEGLNIDAEAVEMVARLGTGSVRDSLSLLDQLVSDPTQFITADVAASILGTANHRAVGELVGALVASEIGQCLAILNQALDEGADPRQFGGQLVEYLRNVLLIQQGGRELVDGTEEQKNTWDHYAKQMNRAALLRAIRLFNTAVSEARNSWQPQLPLELAIIEATRPVVEETVIVHSTAPVTSQRAAVKPADAAPLEPDESPGQTPTEAGVTLKEIRDNFQKVLDLMQQHDKTRLLAQNLSQHGQLTELKGDLLTITTEYPNLYSMWIGDEKYAKTVARAYKRVMDLNIRVRFVLAGNTASAHDELPPVLHDLQQQPGLNIRSEPRR
jgi:DNA polymerase-3 subunit gamma/tau